MKNKKQNMENLTAVIISFLRDEYTKECVRSLRENYSDIKILVAENAEYNQELSDFVEKHGGRYDLMPFDSGVCYARNRLVEAADTEFILVGDDDFYYNDEARVKEMVKFMECHPEYSLIGGRVNEKGEKVLDYQGYLDIYPDHLHYRSLEGNMKFCKRSGLRYQRADITFNYFVARKKDIKDVKWDEKIKVAYEHSDWFIELKQAGGRKVAFTPDAIVIHKPKHVTLEEEKFNRYKEFRNRRSDMQYFINKHKIKYSIGFTGQIAKSEDIKELKDRYYAKRALVFDGKNYNKGEIIETTMPTDDMAACY